MTNQNKISWKHHYLPVFYLKGFTKESKKIKVFDVVKKHFIQNGKEFSPESYFFHKNANTITTPDNLKTDFLEHYYSNFDDKIAKLMSKINSSNHLNRYNVGEDDMPILNHFASLMFWRLPHRENLIEAIIENNDLTNLGLSIYSKDGSVNEKANEKFKKDPAFIKFFRLFNSFRDSVNGISCRTPFSILEKPHEVPFLCSDNPVIFENNLNPSVHKDDYIFPLSGSKIFIRAQKRNQFDVFLWILIDTLLYKQTVKYISCTDEKYIEILDNNFEKNGLSIEELRSEIFKRIK